jgi:DNA-binding MarR family transcriptional regulator
MNSSDVELFERLYTRLWGALNRPDTPDLSQHERQLLHHLTPEQPVSLGWLAGHLGLPKSTTSTIVKRLSERGFLHRVRDPANERQLAITLTDKGTERIADDTVLDPARLRAALSAVGPATRRTLLTGLAQLADAAETLD